MSHTKRSKPFKKLSPKEKKLALKGKYHHPVQIKSSGYEDEYSQTAKKAAKREKHHKQRIDSKNTINEGIKDD
jgi:hypothetical protein